jgi:TolB-like protein/class 3 adenylate cyclase/Flp pilus assembly protein TadD
MEDNEADTLVRLKAMRSDYIDPRVAAHDGRLVKLMGDGALVEFPSVVDAVRCAIDIQLALQEHNTKLPREKRFDFRIGVNLGDIIVDGEDIYGDGVNVAARLEALADPGGVLISGAAFDQVERKLDHEFQFLGERLVKNIEKPVRLYKVILGARRSSSARAPRIAGRLGRGWWAVGTAALAVIVGSVALWNYSGMAPANPDNIASKARMALPLPDKPSIAVLPFTNMSGDAAQQQLADGMTDDVITDLSKIHDLFVIARNSTFIYQGKPVKISQVAEELGVRYVLEGSIQRAGDRIRVNAQLIDALTGGHVWADKFDGDLSDIFAVQDEIESKIVKGLEVNLTKSEKEEITRAKTENTEAKAAFDEGWILHLRLNAKDNLAAIEPLKRAIALDPEYGRAYAALAMVYFTASNDGSWDRMGFSWYDYDATIQRLLAQAKKYPTSLAYTAEALTDAYFGRVEDALHAAGEAIALDPNDPEAHIAMAWALTISGKPTDALSFVAAAVRLNPSYPSHYVLARGTALFAANKLEEAAKVFSEGVQRNPNAVALLPPLASVTASLGRRDAAKRTLLTWRPGVDQRALSIYADTYHFPFRWAQEHARVRERLLDGLRLAALPLDVTVLTLTTELKLGNSLQKRVTAKRLGWFGPAAAEAVPALMDVLKDEYACEYAVDALRKIGPEAKAAVPALVKLQDESIIGSHVKEALKEINGSQP